MQEHAPRGEVLRQGRDGDGTFAGLRECPTRQSTAGANPAAIARMRINNRCTRLFATRTYSTLRSLAYCRGGIYHADSYSGKDIFFFFFFFLKSETTRLVFVAYYSPFAAQNRVNYHQPPNL